MGLNISDQELREAGLSDQDALIEFACRLYQAGRLPLWPAARLARLPRVEFERELRARSIAVYSPSLDDLHQDQDTLRRLGA